MSDYQINIEIGMMSASYVSVKPLDSFRLLQSVKNRKFHKGG